MTICVRCAQQRTDLIVGDRLVYRRSGNAQYTQQPTQGLCYRGTIPVIQPMRISTLSLYVVVCVLSLSIVGLALMTEYLWGEPFYDFVGSLTIRGLQLNAGGEEGAGRITRAMVRYHGFVFDFDTPLIEMRDSRVIARHSIQSYQRQAQTLILNFEAAIELHFYIPSDEQDELLVRIVDTEQQLQDRGATDLSFGYNCPATTCATEQRVFSVRDGDETRYLYLPLGAVIDRSQFSVSLQNPVLTLRFSTVYTPQFLGELEGQARQVLTQAAVPLEEVRNHFIRRAYENWQDYTYLTATGKWVDREGNARFDERIMLANLSEALVHGEYTRVFNTMRRAYQQHKEQITLRALPYLGDSFFLVPQFALAEQQQEEKTISLFDSDEIFDDLYGLHYLYFRAPKTINESFETQIARSDYFNLNTDQLLNMLEYLLFDFAQHKDIIEEIIVNRIVSRIFSNETGLFMHNQENAIDFAATFKTISILHTFSRLANHEQLSLIADALQYSALQMADDNSYLPLFASLKNDRINTIHGSLDPSEIYHLLSPYSYYNKQISLDHERRLWLMSATAIEVEQVTSKKISFSTSAPAEQGVYIVVGNSDRPQKVEIGGTEYQRDRAFQSRIEGWYWFGDHRLLVIKFHRSDNNNGIVIQY